MLYTSIYIITDAYTPDLSSTNFPTGPNMHYATFGAFAPAEIRGRLSYPVPQDIRNPHIEI